ncbi:hypothetical protein [Stenotrophomonas lactitubi]|jgi:hypothetical protein|uniref:hypothetical protein n=1 Tax=Stenotrophomonas lactitubi TaxID=2045214 RepID=UPI00333FECE3
MKVDAGSCVPAGAGHQLTTPPTSSAVAPVSVPHALAAAASLIALFVFWSVAMFGGFLAVSAMENEISAGFIVGFTVGYGLHEACALVTRQQPEFTRYFVAIDHMRRLELLRTDGRRGLLSNAWCANLCKGATVLIALVTFVTAIYGLQFQLKINATFALTLSTIIGATAWGELVLPLVARIQSERIAALEGRVRAREIEWERHAHIGTQEGDLQIGASHGFPFRVAKKRA